MMSLERANDLRAGLTEILKLYERSIGDDHSRHAGNLRFDIEMAILQMETRRSDKKIVQEVLSGPGD